MTASDADWPPSVITYSIIAGGGTKDYTNAFWISPINGDVKILERLDYETTQKHFFTVQASDQEKTATASVSKPTLLLLLVSLLDKNTLSILCHDLIFYFFTSGGRWMGSRPASYSSQVLPVETLGRRYLISLLPVIFQGNH